MFGLDKYDSLFVIWAFVLQVCLIALFAIRKSNLELILRYGWIFYLLCIPAVIVSVIMLRAGKKSGRSGLGDFCSFSGLFLD
jgi:hypothetical protein